VALWAVAGCDCGGAGVVGDPCAADEACDARLTCRDGACAERCDDDRSACGAGCCEVGEVCGLTGLCETPDACTAAGGLPCGGACCQGGQVCQSGVCRADCPTPLCGGSLCCGADEACLAGACCPSAQVCDGACCGAGELCALGECKVDCGGGTPGCGASGACCGAAEVCYQGQCLVPGDPCQPGHACATKPEERPCPEGQLCDPSLLRCVPQVVNEACVYVPPAGVFDPVPLFTWGQRRPRACAADADCQKAERCQGGMCQVSWPHITPATDDLPEHFQVTSTPMVADLDGDCVPEIVFNTYAASNFTADGVLRAVRGDDGRKVWTVSDPAYRTDGTGNPAIGDVDGDGTPEVFVVGPQKNILRIDGDGTPRWSSEPFTGTEGSGSVTLANMDGAGDAEVVFGAAIFDSAGHLLFEGGAGIGIAGQGPISCVADLDGDGRPELIAGRTVYETTGTVAGGDFAGAERVSATTPDGYCGVADLDGNQLPEVVLVTGGTVYVLQGQTMAILAQATLPGGGNGGAPNIADFDGDGRPDIGTAGARSYVVLRYLGEGMLTLLWQAPTEDDSSSRTGSSVFDFDGDGRAEVIYNDEEYLRIYPGVEPACLSTPPGPDCDGTMSDAEILFRDLSSSRTRTEYPVIADVDGDFKAELVFATSNEANFLDPTLVGDAGIEVWADRLDNWVPTRPVWNQHAYHITNAGPRAQLPLQELDSWRADNSYRRNAQGDRETFCAPDLVVRDAAQDPAGCPQLVLKVTLVNQGCLGVGPGVKVAVYDASGGLVAVAETAEAIGPGAAILLEVSADLGPNFQAVLRVVVDDDEVGMGALNECVEDNNATGEVVARCRFDL
jgi:hypothetical protein